MEYKLIIMWRDLWPLVLLALFFLAVSLWGSISERKLWNNGICVETGEPWISFDMSSQG